MRAMQQARLRPTLPRSLVSGASRRVRGGQRITQICRSSGLQQDKATLSELKAELASAVQREDYAQAAALRDAIKQLGSKVPAEKRAALQKQLDQAVLEERYADAAALKAALRELVPVSANDPCRSEAVTDGIVVDVQSQCLPEYSNGATQFFFVYQVSITNKSQRVVRLLNRHWIIMDGNGEVQHIRGPGVIGEQPQLHPGQTYTYSSACPLTTEIGAMEGEYEFVCIDDEGQFGDVFMVKVAKFALNSTVRNVF